MTTLMLNAAEDVRATLADLAAVDALMPAATKTYQPVPHAHLVREGQRIFAEALQMEVCDTRLGLARDGKQMFGVIEFHNPARPDVRPAVGVRNAHDKSFALATCGGAGVFVCSNMCFSGDAFTVMRKHTSRIMDDLNSLLRDAAAGLGAQYQNTLHDLDAFQGVELELDAGYAELGVLFGRGVLNTNQINAAAGYWREPPHVEHKSRDLFGLYQSVNHALKSAHPTRAMEAHAALHGRALELADAWGPVHRFTEDAIEIIEA